MGWSGPQRFLSELTLAEVGLGGWIIVARGQTSRPFAYYCLAIPDPASRASTIASRQPAIVTTWDHGRPWTLALTSGAGSAGSRARPKRSWRAHKSARKKPNGACDLACLACHAIQADWRSGERNSATANPLAHSLVLILPWTLWHAPWRSAGRRK